MGQLYLESRANYDLLTFIRREGHRVERIHTEFPYVTIFTPKHNREKMKQKTSGARPVGSHDFCQW